MTPTELVAFYDRVSPESKYLRFFAPYPRLSERDVRRFTQVDYVDRVALIVTLGEEMIARRPLRPDRGRPGRGGVPDRGRPPGPGHRRSCCWSTWPRRPGNAASPGSWPRCCRRTGGWPRCSPTPAIGCQGHRGRRAQRRVPDPAHRHLGRGDGAPGAPGRAGLGGAAADSRRIVVHGTGDRVQGLVNSMLGGGFAARSSPCAPTAVPSTGVPTSASLPRRRPARPGDGRRADRRARRGGDRRRAQGRARHGGAHRADVGRPATTPRWSTWRGRTGSGRSVRTPSG